MDADFWHRKWANNDIAFHESATNPMLLKHFSALALEQGSRVFLPLCGKTLDIHWLLSRGYRVAGAELSQLAIEQLCAELGQVPTITNHGNTLRYSAGDLDIHVGDFFDVSRETLGPVDAIYDRAALVALPEAVRGRYTGHLMDISGKAPQLLICYEYDQNAMSGPPFAVSTAEVRQHYRDAYALRLLESTEVRGGLKGKVAATENVWLLGR